MNRLGIQGIKLLNVGLIILIPLLVTGFSQENKASTPYVIGPTPRPMSDAADVLQRLYCKVVTYEDPILISIDDTEPITYSTGNIGLLPKSRGFSMPSEVDIKRSPKLDSRLIGSVLNAYDAQTDGPRFKVVSSDWGLHIIPAQVRSRDERLVSAICLLDAHITVPFEKRMPSEHFKAICEAITASTGVTLKDFMPWLNGYYASTDAEAYRFNAEEYKRIVSFEWGATNMIAREAVIDFLKHSSSTLSWKILCEPAEGFCVFNMMPLEVNHPAPNGKARWTPIAHDRDQTVNSK
jgi:hypothetical protein